MVPLAFLFVGFQALHDRVMRLSPSAPVTRVVATARH